VLSLRDKNPSPIEASHYPNSNRTFYCPLGLASFHNWAATSPTSSLADSTALMPGAPPASLTTTLNTCHSPSARWKKPASR
jgi:hypothetical protein